MATRLGIFNDALRSIGDLRLTSLTEDTEAKYVLDDAWQDAVDFCFTEGLWNFATKTEEISADESIEPIPGFSFVFQKPDSWVRTITISPNSQFLDEATYRDESGKIYANFDTLYIRYISNELATNEGAGQWPTAFAKLVSAYLAKECVERLSGSNTEGDRLSVSYKETLASAKNKDALDQSKMILRPGSWVSAMRGSGRQGNRGPLSGY